MAGVPWDEFESFPEYLDAVRAPRGGPQLRLLRGPHRGPALRHGTRGLRAGGRPRSGSRPCGPVIDEALDAGAIGFASSWSPTHNGDHGRPVPSRVADLDELPHCSSRCGTAAGAWPPCCPAACSPTPTCSSSNAISVGPSPGRRCSTFAGSDYHEQVMAEHVSARAAGVDVWPQVSCRPLVFQMNLAEPFSLNTFPNFAALMDAPVERADGRLSGSGVAGGHPEPARHPGASACSTAPRCRWPSRPSRPDLVGRLVVDLAEEQGLTPLDVLLDLSLADDLTSRFWSVLANNNEDGIAWLLPRDDVLLGLADSGAHVSQLCDACFATDLLGNWVRDREVDAPRARRPQAHRRAGPRLRPPRPGDRQGRHGCRPGRVRSGHRRPGADPAGRGLPGRRRAADGGRSPSG